MLARYVREERRLSLAEAVRKLTSYPAWKLRLKDRGLVREGMRADLTIFDPAAVQDLVTRWRPGVHPAGFSHTLVNGQVACTGGMLTGAQAGEVLRP